MNHNSAISSGPTRPIDRLVTYKSIVQTYAVITKFVFVKNPTIRETLVEHSWGQRQVADASDLLILCRVNSLREELVENYISDIIETTGANQEQLEGYKNMMLGFVSNMPKDALEIWAEKQVYIAL